MPAATEKVIDALGTGRRKTSVARVRIRPGSGKLTINERELEHYFPIQQDRNAVLAPLDHCGVREGVDVVIRVHGGDVATLDESTIRAEAGITINGLVRWTINRGISGLEAWAGTPGTVGGAVHGNAHFQGRLISELIQRVILVSPHGEVLEADVRDMQFGYDDSRLHRTGEVVVSADFRAGRGEVAALRAVARESLAFRKRTQPLEAASAGCIFQNPDPARHRIPRGVPASAGALVDRAGLKGMREGNARVSPTHANFIVNDGGATARDIARLIDRCKQEVMNKLGVPLREEIVRLGFQR